MEASKSYKHIITISCNVTIQVKDYATSMTQNAGHLYKHSLVGVWSGKGKLKLFQYVKWN